MTFMSELYSNLKRWKISQLDSCTLCTHSPCYTPHILSGCKVALNQGRYTFRHDTVLNIIHSSLKLFLETIESNTSPDDQPMCKPLSFNFVKKGTKITQKKPKPLTGILHIADDWRLLVDTNSNLVFPAFIAITTSRPDIVLYSKIQKTVVLIELTCPCEENFQERHSDKVLRYSSLCNQIRGNGWTVHFFAVEVGARGYCAQSLFSCLKRLGFSKKAARKLLKDLSFTSLAASFVIWLARDDKSWDSSCPPEVMKRPGLQKVVHKEVFSSPKPTLPVRKGNSKIIRAGIFNKGQTCYVNALLQAISTIPEFWSQVSNTTNDFFTSSFFEIMHSLTSSVKPIDPSRFLRSLTDVIHRSGQTDFNIFSQQDAAEVLEYILNEFSSQSVLARDKLKFVVRTTITCNTCLQESSSLTSSLLWQVPADQNMQEAFRKSLQSEELVDHDCILCESKQSATLDHQVVSANEFIVLHMKRFNQLRANHVVKDKTVVECKNDLVVECGVDHDVSFHQTYRLCATVNHSGTLQAGHYTSFVKDRAGLIDTWSLCNDKAVTNSTLNSTSNNSSYIYFFRRF